jgi:hypothetical protein
VVLNEGRKGLHRRDQVSIKELNESESLYENVDKVQEAVKTDDT